MIQPCAQSEHNTYLLCDNSFSRASRAVISSLTSVSSADLNSSIQGRIISSEYFLSFMQSLFHAV
ncbi:MAG: hypothetical protein IIT39_14175 [Clostridia bacterium]|nr:hypothetical protein [Clostridia bacterium]